MTSPILLTGGTGTLGSVITQLMRDACVDVRVLSRTSHERVSGVEFVVGDLMTGDGVVAAVDGVETIIHCAGTTTGDDAKTRTLVSAAAPAGVRPLVYISVVGADRVPVQSRLDRALFGYFASKRAAEQVVADSEIPWSMLRATQFHDLVLMIVRQLAKLPVIPTPVARVQPVDTREVATRLVELAFGAPAGLVPDMGGPRTYTFKELVRSYLRASGKHRVTMPIRLPGQAARAYRAGANLRPDRAVGHRTWEEFLAARLADAGAPQQWVNTIR